MHDAVVLVTDYGVDDSYAGALIGACWGVEPAVRCVAGTHGVPPGDVLGGAYHVKAAAAAFPAGTVLCAVVDPKVGTSRGAVAVEAGGLRCVAPDTGLVSYLWAESDPSSRRCVAVDTSGAASATFHGRDVFAPVAARLATGTRLEDVGTPLEAPLVLADAFCVDHGEVLEGRVIVIDHFGNAITTIRAADIGDRRPVAALWEGGGTVVVARTYSDLGDRVGVLVGSAGHVEIAAQGEAAAVRGGPPLEATVRLEVVR